MTHPLMKTTTPKLTQDHEKETIKMRSVKNEIWCKISITIHSVVLHQIKRLKRMERIVKAADLYPIGRMHQKVFAGCNTAAQKEAKLRELLKDAGMKGKHLR